mmetsp:Transcript_41358/g.93561  ORF Transcript_41358/g.93561 Transcript_41358/m.93561 type:complete len:826 (-) Transcript_41358:122-2599(-)
MGQNPSSRRRKIVEKPRFLKDGEATLSNPRMNALAGLRYIQGPLERDFDLTRRALGSGFSGVVRCVVHRTTKEKFALKSFTKKSVKPSNVEMMKNEAEVYMQLDHPHICKLMYVYEDKLNVHLVMEHCTGQELYDRLCARKQYTERETQDVTLQMLLALQYCHAHKVVHRDLKLENWMYATQEPSAKIKLIDFGFSKVVEPDVKMDVPCGTLHYASPDVLRKSYTSKCDVWSLGVIVYMLLSGSPPFHGKTNREIIDRINKSKLRISATSTKWRTTSAQARAFVQRLLDRDPATRPTAKEAMADPWIAIRRDVQLRGTIGADVPDELRGFAQSKHLKRAAFLLMAQNLSSRDLDDLGDTFLLFDVDGDGALKLQDFRRTMQQVSQISDSDVQKIFRTLQTIPPVSAADDNERPCQRAYVRDEIQYTDFIAGIMQRKLRQHDSKLRMVFEAFDWDHSGYITVENLIVLYGESHQNASMEDWIREVDIKGNGVVDWDEFLHALGLDNDAAGTGVLSEAEQPKVMSHIQQGVVTAVPMPLRAFRRDHVVDGFLLGRSDFRRFSNASMASWEGTPVGAEQFPCIITYNRQRGAGHESWTLQLDGSDVELGDQQKDSSTRNRAKSCVNFDVVPLADTVLRRTVSEGGDPKPAHNLYKVGSEENLFSPTAPSVDAGSGVKQGKPDSRISSGSPELETGEGRSSVNLADPAGAYEPPWLAEVEVMQFGGGCMKIHHRHFYAEVPQDAGEGSGPRFQRSKVQRIIRTGLRTHQFTKHFRRKSFPNTDAGVEQEDLPGEDQGPMRDSRRTPAATSPVMGPASPQNPDSTLSVEA